MAKKQNNPQNKTAPSGRPWWLWLAGVVAVLLLGGGIFLLLDGGAVAGTPKVVVDQPVIDEGYQTFNTQVRTAFTIRNSGDGVLRILEQPQVELVEGC
ncbi:MAG: hypothetical protein Kow0031_35420 [Anaerolineae bacterium]